MVKKCRFDPVNRMIIGKVIIGVIMMETMYEKDCPGGYGKLW